MVTLQILVLPFLVRIRVPQPLKREASTHGSLFFSFCINRQRKPFVYTKTPLSSVSSSSWGMVAEAWLVVIFHIALLLACVAVWRGTGACLCRAQAGDGEGECCVLGSENFFSPGQRKKSLGREKIFPFERGKISHSCRGHILSENGWSTGGSSCGRDWDRVGGVFLFVNIFRSLHAHTGRALRRHRLSASQEDGSRPGQNQCAASSPL